MGLLRLLMIALRKIFKPACGYYFGTNTYLRLIKSSTYFMKMVREKKEWIGYQ